MEKKQNWQEFEQVLKEARITKLYHFTDFDNLESIIQNGGLYFWADCRDKGIKIPKPGSSGPSRSLDERDPIKMTQELRQAVADIKVAILQGQYEACKGGCAGNYQD